MKNNLINIPRLAGLIIAIALLASGCKKDEFGEKITTPPGYQGGNGVFIVNEGSYGNGNASITFRHDVSGKVYQDIFRHANGVPLGDVAVSMSIISDTGIIVVNNSGLLQFVRLADMKTLGTITGLPSPRHIVHDGGVSYVSDLSQGYIHIINRSTMTKVGEIPTGRSVENMVIQGGFLYANAWSNFYINKPNNLILVIDLQTRAVVDSIQVTKEPNSMVLDKNQHLWVLSSGGYLGEEVPALQKIDLTSRAVVWSLVFPTCCDYPTALQINAGGDMLYFLNMGVYRMDITSQELPTTPFFQGGGYLYGLACDPGSGHAWVADAVDFQIAGKVYMLDNAGNISETIPTGIAPSFFCFRR